MNVSFEKQFVSDGPPGFSVTGMVLGIIGLTFWWIPLAGVIPAILALTFGYLGRRQSRERGRHSDGLGMTAVVTGWVTLGLTVVMVIITASVL